MDFTGTIQYDGYAGYGAFADRRPGEAGPITLAGCWAHVRRKFHDALEQSPRTAGWLQPMLQSSSGATGDAYVQTHLFTEGRIAR